MLECNHIDAHTNALMQVCGESHPKVHVPCTKDTIFMCASISKLVTATLALQACERGLLRLDENINTHLPAACHVYHPSHPGVGITPYHLLTHRSGLFDDEGALLARSRWRECNEDPNISLAQYVAQRLCVGGKYSDEVRWARSVCLQITVYLMILRRHKLTCPPEQRPSR